MVAEAVGRGWAVTTFNRGVTGSEPVGVEALRGDRLADADLSIVDDRRWDAVVDTWSGAPSAVAGSARVLAGAADTYVFVSSRSVYLQPRVAGMAEDAPVKEPTEDGELGAMKVGAELAVRQHFGDRALIARTGLVLGPHEDVGRLPWWLTRVAAGGDVLAPGPEDLALQYVDARDLAAWLLDSVARRLSGTFNALSRPGHTTMGEVLDCCRRVTGAAARLVWTAPEEILADGTQPWSDVPIWVPPGHPWRHLHETNTDKAFAAGLRCRPVEQTVADTWAWMRAEGLA